MNYLIPILFFSGIGIVVGIVLTVAGRLFRVIVDDTVERLVEQLPGINCGACGFASCERYAAAVKAEKVAANQCKPGGEEVATKIGEVLGREVSAAEPETAFVQCAGNCTRKYRYKGTDSCRASAIYYNGKEVCRFGCLGVGDCIKVCLQEAIEIRDRRAVILQHKCNACGLCVKACPKKVIKIQKAKQAVRVACCSHDPGKVTRSICTKGCIGCKICERKCPKEAIKVRDNVAVINSSLCDNCWECVGVCPTKCITVRRECEAQKELIPSSGKSTPSNPTLKQSQQQQ